MKKNILNLFLWISCLLFIIFGPILTFAQNAPTDVGVKFLERTEQSSTTNTDKKEPSEVVTPTMDTHKLPQLGQLIEPLVVIMLGLLIWLIGICAMTVRSHLKRKEGN